MLYRSSQTDFQSTSMLGETMYTRSAPILLRLFQNNITHPPLKLAGALETKYNIK